MNSRHVIATDMNTHRSTELKMCSVRKECRYSDVGVVEAQMEYMSHVSITRTSLIVQSDSV